MITSFLAQGYTTLEAKLGVYLHGLAADITLQNTKWRKHVNNRCYWKYIGLALKPEFEIQ